MSILKIAAPALLLAGAAPAALIAQTTEEPKTTFGSQVSVMAKEQKDAETKGIGAEVSALAKQRNADRAAARGDDADDDDDNDDATTTTTTADATAPVAVKPVKAENEKSAKTLAADVAANKGANNSIKDGTGPVADLVAARSAAAEARGNSSTARETAALARQNAADARASASNAREQARAIRDTVAGARPGKGN